MRYHRVLASAAALAAVISFAGVADAGGSSGGLIGGGSSGGSSGGAFGARLASLKSRLHAGGSSGGASLGSSGGGALRARLSSLGSRIGSGSSGGGGLLSRIKSGGSSGGSGGSSGGGLLSKLGSKLASGGSTGGSSGGVSLGGSSGGRVGPIRRLAAKLRSHGSGGGSTGGGSSGGIVSSHGSSGGSVSDASPVSYTTPAISSSTSIPVQTISLGASADSYESPVVQSSYQAYSSPAPAVIDSGYYDSGIVSSDPISSVPVYSDPIYSAPIYSAPIYSAPINDSGTVINGTVIDGGYETGTVIDSGSSILNSAPISSGETIIDSSSYESKKPAIGDDTGLLTVAVPNSSATVTVNGHSTSSEGTVRQFMSKGLKKGYVYTYVVKIDYELNGKTFADSKEVKLRPGDTKQVVFDTDEDAKTAEPSDMETTKSQEPSAKVITVVKLMVPADAVVNLAGNDTNGAGPIRTFRTTALKAGEKWENYTVRVSTRIGGQLVSREQTVNVVAGSTTELEFDFEGLAKR